MNKFKGFLSLFIAGIIFGSFGVLIRILNQELTTYQQIGFRSLIGFIISLILIKTFHQSYKSLKKVNKKFWISFSLIMPVSIVFFVLAMINTAISVAIFSFYIGSIFSSLIIGKLIFKEKFSANKLMSLLVVLIGLFFFVQFSRLNSLDIGIFYAMLAGIIDTISNSFRKKLSGQVDRIVLTSLPLFGGLLLMSVLILLSGQSLAPTLSPLSWLIGALFGGLLFCVNYLLNYGFKNFDLNLGTIVISSELFFASAFGYLFYKEIPKINEIYGGLFVLLAVLITNLNIKSLRPKTSH